MGIFILNVLLMALVTEAITQLVIKSEIFQPARGQISKLGYWPSELMKCGYCFSVWAAFLVVGLGSISYSLTGNSFVDFLFVFILVHRLSNIMHNGVDKWTDKYYSLAHINSEKSED